jgi:hypothetical protein
LSARPFGRADFFFLNVRFIEDGIGWVGEFSFTLFINMTSMLVTIAALLVILWLLGLVTSYTLGGFIHILLVIAIIAVLIRLIRGENPIA